MGHRVVDMADEVFVRLHELGGRPDSDDHADRGALEALRLESAAVEASMRRGSNPRVLFRARDGLEGLRDGEPEIEPHGEGPWGGFVPGNLPDFGDFGGAESRLSSDLTPQTLLQELNRLLREPYQFTVFGADPSARSVNFGVVTTYRQKWEPIAYQAGDLAKTVTLAPQESREFKMRHVVRRKRNEREITRSSSAHKEQLETKARAEAEIVEKAAAKTNFSLSAQGSYNIGISKGTSTTSIGRDAARDSAEARKDLRESTVRAAQEYKQERSVEIEMESALETEETVTGRVKNTNDELAVTFLFYELQRRYRIHEELHRVTPVVLVAQEVPQPDEISEGWLISRDWVLKRTLLDDTFRPALDYLSTNYEGDRLTILNLEEDVTLHRDIIRDLRLETSALEKKRTAAYATLQAAIEERAEAAKDDSGEGFFTKTWEFFSGDDKSPEAARILEDAARDAVDRATAELKEHTMKLEREVTALAAATERYQKFLATHNNMKVQIQRLKLHVRQNILYYMQANWSYEPPDQRYFRLYQTSVPTFEDGGSTYELIRVSDDMRVGSTVDGPLSATAVDLELTPQVQARIDEASLRPLVEVADLDDLLGFKGNYMIFPLKESNALTDVLMDPYVDAGFQDLLALIDPDETAMMSRRDFARFVECLHQELDEDAFEEMKPALRSMYQKILQAASRPGEEIIVPTGSLFIEALPAAHPLLENFKLAHRAVDVKKARAEAPATELENLRVAARLLASDEHITLLEDPDIERKVVIEGQTGGIIVPPDSE